jgi:hypothetical protein
VWGSSVPDQPPVVRRSHRLQPISSARGNCLTRQQHGVSCPRRPRPAPCGGVRRGHGPVSSPGRE